MNGIKSKYILLKIFDLLLKKKTFKIIKYNQKIQDILEIELDDYINFHNLIPKIEIELSISNNISKEKNIFLLILKKLNLIIIFISMIEKKKYIKII